MKTKDFKYFIEKYELKTGYNPVDKQIGLRPSAEKEKELFLNKEDLEKIRENKAEIITFIKDEEKRKKEEHEQEINEQKKIMNNAEIEYFIFEYGCDTGDTYFIKYKDDEKIAWEAVQERKTKDIDAIKELVSKFEDYVEENKIEKIDPKMMTYGGYKFNKEQTELLIAKGREKQEEKLNKKEKKNQEEDQKKQEIFKKAKETNEAQLLYRTMDDCDGSEDDCSFDEIYVYVMPNGSTKTKRIHCH